MSQIKGFQFWGLYGRLKILSCFMFIGQNMSPLIRERPLSSLSIAPSGEEVFLEPFLERWIHIRDQRVLSQVEQALANKVMPGTITLQVPATSKGWRMCYRCSSWWKLLGRNRRSKALVTSLMQLANIEISTSFKNRYYCDATF